jgi:hypothetical protein
MKRVLSMICVLLATALVSLNQQGVDATVAPTTTTTFEYNTGTQVFGSLSINYAQYTDGAKVRISSNFQSGYDTLYLQYYGGAAISSSFNTATGILSITGTATGVEYARILNSVYFKTTSYVTSPVPWYGTSEPTCSTRLRLATTTCGSPPQVVRL